MNDRQQIQATEADKALPQSASQSPRERERAMLPRVDVVEDAGGITLWADLPGVAKDQLDLRVEGDSLLIEAPVTPSLPERLQPLYAEVRVPRFRRSFTLSRELDTQGIEANLKDGVLQLRIPKHDHAQARRVQVQVG